MPTEGLEYSSTLSWTSVLDGGEWSTPGRGRITPGKETRYLLWRRLGGPQDLFGRERKISTSPVLDPRTVQPVVSRYTDYAISAQWTLVITVINLPVLQMTVNFLSSWATYEAALRLLVLGTINTYPTAFPYGNGMVLHFYQQQESSTTKTVHKVINKGLKAYV